jgi:hypothetical protein
MTDHSERGTCALGHTRVSKMYLKYLIVDDL